jgi:fatty acid desaturase
MALSPDERRFLKSWEEQRKGGKASFVGVYTFGLFILFYLAAIALGLFSGVPFIKVIWLLLIGIFALAGAFFLSLFLWNRQQKKFSTIVKRELAESMANEFPAMD